MPRASLLLAAAALLALLAPALAQVPAPGVRITLAPDALRVDANGTATLEAIIAYEDAVPGAQGTVTVQAAAPRGWSIVIEPAQTFPMASGTTRTLTLTAHAPPTAEGAATGDAVVDATVVAGAGRPAGTASATLALARVDPAPPPPPPDRAPLVMAGLLALAILAGGALAYRHHRQAERAAWLARETGIALGPADAPEAFGDRREIAVRVTVRNDSGRARVAVVDVAEAPPGWRAAINVPRRELLPGEAMRVTLVARPPADAPLRASARIVLSARPEEAREHAERLVLDVQAPEPRPAPARTQR